MVEQTLMLSSPKAQPFGVLSSKAVIDFTVGSHSVPNPKYSFRHGAWKTVTPNMFKKDKHRQRMSGSARCGIPSSTRMSSHREDGP